MHILLSGSRGLIGSALVPLLQQNNHTVTRLVRSRPGSQSEAFWNPERGELDDSVVARCDAVIHLSGEPVAGRWTEKKKAAILSSRIDSTRLLAESIARCGGRQVLVCASAIGIYGDRGDDELVETSAPGAGFLAHVCREWEAAADPAREAGARVAHGRIGIVLSPNGGALGAMLPPAKLGLGGPLGSGQQFWSWISIRDVARALLFAVENDSIVGPINLASPNAVRNVEMARTLGRVLRRPAILPAPAFALRALLGEAADEMLLFSQRVRPQVLEKSGFRFEQPDLERALREML